MYGHAVRRITKNAKLIRLKLKGNLFKNYLHTIKHCLYLRTRTQTILSYAKLHTASTFYVLSQLIRILFFSLTLWYSISFYRRVILDLHVVPVITAKSLKLFSATHFTHLRKLYKRKHKSHTFRSILEVLFFSQLFLYEKQHTGFCPCQQEPISYLKFSLPVAIIISLHREFLCSDNCRIV